MALDLGKILLKHRIISAKELNRALHIEATSGGSLTKRLVTMGSVTEDQIAKAISVEFAIPSVKLEPDLFDREALHLVSRIVADKYCVVPIFKKDNTLTLATADPTNTSVVDDLKVKTGLDIKLVVSTESDITAAIAELYGKREFESGSGLSDTIGYQFVSIEVKAPNYTVVKIFYATDREQTGDQAPSKFYAGERKKEDCLTYGTCEVSIPRDHKLAHIERPSWRNCYREDPEKHIVLLSLNLRATDNYFSELSADIASSGRKQVLVFIHGFDVTFEEGVWRTAQLAYDLGFDGPPVLYSWPSIGRLRDYTVDEATMEWSVPHLKGFISDVATKCDAQMVHIIAHSMGNRILANALKEIALAPHPGASPQLQEVILTAPDIDAGVFRQIAGEIQKSAKRVTLYASSNDKALEASKKIHGGPRAGDSGDGIVIVPGVDTIDASAVDTTFIGHFYYGDNRSVLSDIFHLLGDGAPPGKRFGLRQKSLLNAVYWAFS
jgi:esterase/lipase superfamily enzyme